MLTFFARHGSELDIDRATYEKLWNENLVGIHFPQDKNGWNDKNDTASIDPVDYDFRSAKSCLNAMHELSMDGGYVCGVYEGFAGCKLGYVEPDTAIRLTKGKWGTKNGVGNRVAILKTIKLSRAINLGASESISLLTAQPRQGTFSRWWKIGKRVENIVENKIGHLSLDDLTPDLQEVMCSEFLRSELSKSMGLPKLEALLLPVGRTMKDIDLIGIDESGNKIIGQVTYSKFENVKWKLDKLLDYTGNHRQVIKILFCDVPEPEVVKGVNIFPIKKVFNIFCKETSIGGQWLKTVR